MKHELLLLVKFSTFRVAKVQTKGLTCDWLNGFAGHGLANEIILNKAGGLGRNLHWVLRAFGPRVDHLAFRVGICGQPVTSLTKQSYLLWNFQSRLATDVPVQFRYSMYAISAYALCTVLACGSFSNGALLSFLLGLFVSESVSRWWFSADLHIWYTFNWTPGGFGDFDFTLRLLNVIIKCR